MYYKIYDTISCKTNIIDIIHKTNIIETRLIVSGLLYWRVWYLLISLKTSFIKANNTGIFIETNDADTMLKIVERTISVRLIILIL